MNYWRLTPFIDARLKHPTYRAVPLGGRLPLVQYGSSALAKSELPGFPMLRMNNLQDDGWDLTDLKYVELGEKEFETYRLAPGDILFNRTNSKELVGKCAVFREEGDWVFASYLIRVRTNGDELLSDFASIFLGTAIGRLQIDQLSRQIIGMTNINAEEIRELRIPLPSIARQAEFVAAMDAARAQRDKKLVQADELLEGMDDFILQALKLPAPRLVDRKVFAVPRFGVATRFDPHFHAPEFVRIQEMLANTICVRLGDIVTLSKDSWKPTEHDSATFRYIEIGGVNPKTGEAVWTEVPTKEAPTRARMLVQPDDIIVSLTRPHHGSIAHLSDDFAGCIASTGFAVVRSLRAGVRRDYLWCILRWRYSLRQMLQRSSGGNYPAITEDELANIIVPLPNATDQEAIGNEIRRRREEARRLRTEADAEWQAAKVWFEDQLLGGR